MNYIEQLQDVIRRLHGCEATYLESVPVREVFQGAVVWEGDVEVFNIRGHPKATRAYAWAHSFGGDGKQKRYVAVLELPPVTSAQTAVKAAIVDEYRQRQNDKEGGG